MLALLRGRSTRFVQGLSNPQSQVEAGFRAPAPQQNCPARGMRSQVARLGRNCVA
jgi:hypothetical protein